MQFLEIQLSTRGKGVGFTVTESDVVQTRVNPVELELGVAIPVPVQTYREVRQSSSIDPGVIQVNVRNPSKNFPGTSSTTGGAPRVARNDPSKHAVLSVVRNVFASQHVSDVGIAARKQSGSSAGKLSLSPSEF